MFKAYFLNLHETPYARILEGRKTSIPKLKFSYLETFFLSINRENSSLCLERKKKIRVFLVTPCALNLSLKPKTIFFFLFFPVSLLQQIFKEIPWSARRFGSCGEKFLEEITIEGFQRFWGYGGKTSGAFAEVTIESLAVKVFYK